MEKFSTIKYLNSILEHKYLTKFWRINPRIKSRVKKSIFFITRDFPADLDFKYRVRALRAGFYLKKDIICRVTNCNKPKKINRKRHLSLTCGDRDAAHQKIINNQIAISSKNSRTKEDRLKSSEKAKKTFINKYGVDNPMKNLECHSKAIDTNLKKYGVKYPTQSKEIIEIRKKNNYKKYGVDEPSKLDTIKKKIKDTNLKKYGYISSTKHPEVKKKIFNTNLIKYGVPFPTQIETVKAKIRNTNLKRYGAICVFQSEEIKAKIRDTNLKKYGYLYATQSPEVKQKLRDKWPETKKKVETTNLKKYGFRYTTQSSEIKQRLSNNWSLIKPKIEATNLKKYGFKYAVQSPEVKQKLRDKWPETKKKVECTNLDKYKAKTFMQAHLKNTHLLTKEYLEENFLDKNKNIKMKEMMQFYNMKETACYRYMRDLDIKIKYKSGGFNPDKPATLYYIYDPQEDLYKIGITNNTIEERFGKTFCSNRAIAILEQINYPLGRDAYHAEQEILEAFEYSRCKNPSWPEELGGSTEFFKEDILQLNKYRKDLI